MNAMNIEAIVCTLDGALLNHSHDVTPSCQDALTSMAARGCVIGLASSRPIEFMQDNLERWGLQNSVHFLIGNNGASYASCVRDRSFRSRGLSRQHLQAVKKAVKKAAAAGVMFGIVSGQSLHVPRHDLATVTFAAVNGLKVVSPASLGDLERYDRILIFGKSSVLKPLTSLQVDSLRLISCDPGVLEVVRSSTTKLDALALACEEFGFQPEHTLCFGSSDNDIDLLAGTIGVSMKNASRHAAAASRFATKYNNSQDGIAYHLNTLLFARQAVFGTEARQRLQARQSALQSEPAHNIDQQI